MTFLTPGHHSSHCNGCLLFRPVRVKLSLLHFNFFGPSYIADLPSPPPPSHPLPVISTHPLLRFFVSMATVVNLPLVVSMSFVCVDPSHVFDAFFVVDWDPRMASKLYQRKIWWTSRILRATVGCNTTGMKFLDAIRLSAISLCALIKVKISSCFVR